MYHLWISLLYGLLLGYEFSFFSNEIKWFVYKYVQWIKYVQNLQVESCKERKAQRGSGNVINIQSWSSTSISHFQDFFLILFFLTLSDFPDSLRSAVCDYINVFCFWFFFVFFFYIKFKRLYVTSDLGLHFKAKNAPFPSLSHLPTPLSIGKKWQMIDRVYLLIEYHLTFTWTETVF